MDSFPHLAESVCTRQLNPVIGKLRSYRYRIPGLAYVNLAHGNGGIIRNLSETGIALQAIAPLQVNQQVYVRLELTSPRLRVEAIARVGWIDSFGQAGVQFLNLPLRTRRLLKEWIFTQLLACTHRASAESIFLKSESEVDLLFSPSHRPSLSLDAAVGGAPSLGDPKFVSDDAMVRFLWCPVSFSAGSLSWLIDSLILVSAVLLFLILSLAMTRSLPAWTVVSGLGLGVACVFTSIYWFLFTVWMSATPGTCLVQRAWVNSRHGTRQDEVERPRFR